MLTVKEGIGLCIKRWREFKNIKQETLALELSISKAALSHIENGKTDITITRIEQIANIIKIDLIQLLSTPQQLIYAGKKSNDPSNSIDNSKNNAVNDEVIKLLQEELLVKNKQLDQIMLALNRCLTNNSTKNIIIMFSLLSDI